MFSIQGQFYYDVDRQLVLLNELSELYSFAKNQKITIHCIKHINMEDLYDHFHLPLSDIADSQLRTLHEITSNLISLSDNDSWVFPWKGNT
jgi:hypothetical protein